MNKPNLYMLIGIPGSGKSTFAKLIQPVLNYKILSSDEYRKNMFGSEDDQEHNSQIFTKLHEDMNDLLSKGENVCYDATNIKRSDRKACLKSISYPCEKIAIFIRCSVDEAKKRNSNRDRIVPDEVIDKMYSNLIEPSIDEGFDEIINIDV